MRKIISVEGNIASGKSTFLDIIKEYNPNFNIIPEPIHEWQNVMDPRATEGSSFASYNSYNLFELAAQEPSKYLFPFQLTTLNSHIKMLSSAKQFDGVSVLERCYLTNSNVFTKQHHDNGVINDPEWAVYNLFLTDHIIKPYGKNPIDGFVYVKTDPEICFKRLQKRNRTEENKVGLDYLEKLHKLHEEWLNRMFQEGIKILTVDNNLEKMTLKSYSKDIDNINKFLKSI